MRKCAKIDCPTGAEANYFPMLEFWAEGHKPGDHHPGQAMMGFLLCEVCMLKAKAQQLIDGGPWNELVRVYLSMGKAAPDRKTARVVGLEWSKAPKMWREHYEAKNP